MNTRITFVEFTVKWEICGVYAKFNLTFFPPFSGLNWQCRGFRVNIATTALPVFIETVNTKLNTTLCGNYTPDEVN